MHDPIRDLDSIFAKPPITIYLGTWLNVTRVKVVTLRPV